MRSSPRLLLVVPAIAIALGCGPKPAPAPTLAQVSCAKEKSCNALPAGQTEQQCIDNVNGCLNELNKGAQVCKDFATALTNFASCQDGLSCDDYNAQNLNGKCPMEQSDLSAKGNAIGSTNCNPTGACDAVFNSGN